MLPSILALQRTRGPPLAGLRSVPKIHLAQGELFEDPGYLPRAQDKQWSLVRAARHG